MAKTYKEFLGEEYTKKIHINSDVVETLIEFGVARLLYKALNEDNTMECVCKIYADTQEFDYFLCKLGLLLKKGEFARSILNSALQFDEDGNAMTGDEDDGEDDE